MIEDGYIIAGVLVAIFVASLLGLPGACSMFVRTHIIGTIRARVYRRRLAAGEHVQLGTHCRVYVPTAALACAGKKEQQHLAEYYMEIERRLAALLPDAFDARRLHVMKLAEAVDAKYVGGRAGAPYLGLILHARTSAVAADPVSVIADCLSASLLYDLSSKLPVAAADAVLRAVASEVLRESARVTHMAFIAPGPEGIN